MSALTASLDGTETKSLAVKRKKKYAKLELFQSRKRTKCPDKATRKMRTRLQGTSLSSSLKNQTFTCTINIVEQECDRLRQRKYLSCKTHANKLNFLRAGKDTISVKLASKKPPTN